MSIITKLLKFGVAGLAVLLLATPAHATLIDFDDGVNRGFIGAFYAGLGVTFSANSQWDNFVSIGEGPAGAGGLKVADVNGANFQPKVGNPIGMTFSFAVSEVELLALNIGANGIQVDAYDSVVGGNLVDSVSDFGIGVGATNHPLLLVSDVGIRRVEVYQPQSNIIEGFLFDNLRFEAADAPEPATLALLGFGLATLGLTRRRTRTH